MNVEREIEHSQNENDKALEGWTKLEKYELLRALKTFGSHAVSSIQSMIKSKTLQEVEVAIAYYKDKAYNIPEDKKRRKTCKASEVQQSSVPLANWAKILTDSLSFEELETDTATALRFIADLEDIPPAVCTEDIDFRKAYHLLANAMDGKSLQYDKGQSLLINKCLIETALIGKAFMKKSTLKNLVHNLDITDKEVKSFPKHTASRELTTVQHLVSQKNYNPLMISENFLTSSNI